MVGRWIKLLGLFLLAVTVVSSASLAIENLGRFTGELVAKFLRDGRNMQLEQPFSYIDPNGREWNVPAGTQTDGASVPQFFWVAFPPFTGQYRAAAVIHDHYCQTKERNWRETHEVFYNAMRAAGVGETTAKALYGAVYHFGPRWGIGTASRGPGAAVYKTPKQQNEFFDDLNVWIERENPSLDQITQRLSASGKLKK
jgi:hypothetical protein